MSARILSGYRVNECDKPGAVIYDGTTGHVYPTLFCDEAEAQAFLDWLSPIDPHHVLDGEMHLMVREFRAECKEKVTT